MGVNAPSNAFNIRDANICAQNLDIHIRVHIRANANVFIQNICEYEYFR